MPSFQSTHPARGATARESWDYPEFDVSIHAPREGCDKNSGSRELSRYLVSIHAPREGCDFR